MRESFSADPTVVFLTSVLDDIEQGRIRIPRFQRPLVWSWQQRKEFLESIFAGLPIGALMIWVTSNEDVSCYDRLGPHPLPDTPIAGDGRYLMDGVQRVSTLYGALRATQGWRDFDEEREVQVRDFVIYADLAADLDTERFKRSTDISAADLKADPTRYLPLNIVLTRELLRFQRDLADDEGRLDRADEIASAFRQYKVPIITLNSASLEVVTKSFERINTRGAPMSELHMLNALTYSSKFDLLKRDQELREKTLWPFGWHNIDSDIVLRCLKLSLGVDIYKTNPDEVSRSLRSNPGALERTFRGLGHTARLFKDKFGITDPAIVPYRNQIVAIAQTLFDQPYEDNAQKLTDWVWLSTYTELFGRTGRESESAIDDLHSFIRSGSFEWSLREQPAVRNIAEVTSDARAARVKGLMLALAKRADDIASDKGKAMLEAWDGSAFQFIPLPGIRRGEQGARFLVEPAYAAELRLRLINRTLSDSQRELHLVSDRAWDLIDAKNMKPFTRQRAIELFEYEREAVIDPVARRLEISFLRVLGQKDNEFERREDDTGEN